MNPDTVCWMQALADHHSAMRARHPHERLLVMFDIDGTLLDTRCTMLWVLREYDVVHGTRWFEAFDPNAIRWHEARVERVLEDAGVPPEERTPIDAWYRARFWNAETMRNSLHAFEGAMDLVRHLQRTPGTEIALNTGRPEFLQNSWFTLRADKMLVTRGLDHTLADGLAFERANSPGRGPALEERLKAFGA